MLFKKVRDTKEFTTDEDFVFDQREEIVFNEIMEDQNQPRNN
ncbi:hypothetical protein Q2T40_04565 [Winogradskyella maritima]|nr:hypothetical protein [Winogradskyella maritima]